MVFRDCRINIRRRTGRKWFLGDRLFSGTHGAWLLVNEHICIYCFCGSHRLTYERANALANDVSVWNSFCIRCIGMDDRSNAIANACLGSVCGQTICHNERTHAVVHRCEHGRALSNDVSAKMICRILRMRTDAPSAHHPMPAHVLRRLGSPLSDWFPSPAPIYSVWTMWPASLRHPLDLEWPSVLGPRYLRVLKSLEIKSF